MLPALAAFVAGAMNSVAGGGSFLSFPRAGLRRRSADSANATNNAAMWVGTLGSARGYREEVAAHRSLLFPVNLRERGGVADRLGIAARYAAALFERLIPWLLLFATVVFAASPFLVRRTAEAPRHSPWQIAVQFAWRSTAATSARAWAF